MLAQNFGGLKISADQMYESNGSYIVFEGKDVTLSFSYEDSIAHIGSVESIRYVVDDTLSYNILFNQSEIINDSCYLEVNNQEEIIKSLAIGTHQVKVVLTCQSSDSVLQSIDLSRVENIRVLGSPQFKGVESSSQKFYLGSKELEWSAKVEGGNDQGWSCVWTVGSDSIIGNDLRYFFDTPGEYEITLSAKNTIGEEGTVLYSEDKVYSERVIIYDIPSVKKKTFPDSEYSDVSNETNDLSWSVDASGGNPNGWKYVWVIDGKEIEGTAELNQSLGIGNHSINLKVTNEDPNGNVWFDEAISFPEVYVYGSADASIDEQPSIVEYKNVADQTEELHWSIKVSGGNPEAWVYSWYIDEKLVQSGTQNKLSKQLSLGIHNISVIVENISTIGSPLCSKSIEFNNIYVYAVSSVNCSIQPDKIDFYSETPTLKWELTANGGNSEDGAWKFSWTDNGVEIGSSSILEVAYPEVSVKELHVIKYQVTNYDRAGKEIATYADSYTITIYPKASVKVNTEAKSDSLYRKSVFLSWDADVNGGNDSGWKYIWKINGEEKSATKSFYDIFKPGKYDLILEVKNMSPDGKEVWYENSDYKFSFNVVLDARPTVVLDTKELEGYSGRTIQAKVHVVDSPEESEWSFDWTFNGVTTTTKDSVYLFTLPKIETGTWSGIVSVKSHNNLATEIVDAEHHIPVRVYSIGQVSLEDVDSVNVYSSTLITLKVSSTGGKDSAWTYEWMDNGDVISSTTSSTYSFVPSTIGYASENHTYSVRARNVINGVVGCDETVRFTPVTLWPQCQFPDKFIMTDMITQKVSSTYGIREGNDFALSIPYYQGGYIEDNRRTVQWTYNDEMLTEINPIMTASMKNAGKDKLKESVMCEVVLTHYGPYGHVWDKKKYSQTINVFRKPSIPIGLTKKGNGASGTLIATTSLSDSELSRYEYYLVFGYDSSDGTTVIKTPVLQTTGNTRYDVFTPSELSNTHNRFWVYSQWNYSEDVRITSGKRYLDGSVDEMFDGSVFSSTRSTIDETTAISSVVEQEAIKIDSECFDVNLSSASDVILIVYCMDGKVVRKLHYAKSNCIHNMLPVEGLAKGMYIVEVIAGDKRSSKKIFVK